MDCRDTSDDDDVEEAIVDKGRRESATGPGEDSSSSNSSSSSSLDTLFVPATTNINPEAKRNSPARTSPRQCFAASDQRPHHDDDDDGGIEGGGLTGVEDAADGEEEESIVATGEHFGYSGEVSHRSRFTYKTDIYTTSGHRAKKHTHAHCEERGFLNDICNIVQP